MNFINKIIGRVRGAFRLSRLEREAGTDAATDIRLVHTVVGKRRFPSLRQWAHVSRVMTGKERRIFIIFTSLLIAGLLILAGRWTIMHARLVPTHGGEYREGIVGAPRIINPVLTTGNDVDQDIIRLVYSGLYRRDSFSRLTPDLAQNVDVSADGKTYTFTLKEAQFHDGEPLTADDVTFTIGLIQNQAWKSPLGRNFHGVSVKTIDARTVQITLDKPSAYLPSLLTVGILPQHIWEGLDLNSVALTDFNLKPVGSGPFRFEKFVRDNRGNILSYSLKAVEKGVGLERLTLKFFDDYESALDKLSSNVVDGLNFVPRDKRDAVSKIPGVVLHDPALSQYTAIFLNPKTQSAFADVNVRQALAYALDRERIVREALNGIGTLRDSPIPQGATGSTSEITHYGFDPSRAGALLDQAGFAISPETKIRTQTQTSKPKSSKEKPSTTTTELKVSLTIVDSEENRRVAQIIKENWETLGVPTDVQLVASVDIQKTVIKTRSYQALIYGEIIGPDTDPYPFWHSSQIEDGLNLSYYNNRRVDELLEKAQLTTTDVERGTLLAEFQKIITAEVPAIILFEPTYLYPQTSNIQGWDVKLMISPADRFSNIADWYRKKRLIFE